MKDCGFGFIGNLITHILHPFNFGGYISHTMVNIT